MAHTSYVAAQKLTESGDGKSATIDVSEWKNGQYSSSLDGYTIKVWMEDGSGSLAAATTPVTFVGTSQRNFKRYYMAPKLKMPEFSR